MGKKSLGLLFSLIVFALLLGGCGTSAPSDAPTPDRVATRVEQELAVAATLTAAAPSIPEASASQSAPAIAQEPASATSENAEEAVLTPTPASTAPVITPTPTEASPEAPATEAPLPSPLPPAPTPILVAVLPVDGGGGDIPNIRNSNEVKGGRNVTLPGYSPAEISEPMVYRDRIVFQAQVFDTNVGTNDGNGIENVQFIISDDQGRQVHFRQENNAGYCVFGGGEPDCNVLFLVDSGYRWPDGERIYPGRYDVEIVINPQYGEDVIWMWSFDVELSQSVARINSISVQGDRYDVDFQTSGFVPQLPGQHVHFFFDTVPPEEAGMPGKGPWILYGGSSPFTEYGPADTPESATSMCVLVANEDHSVQPNSGNCHDIPYP